MDEIQRFFYKSCSLSHWGRIHKISSILSNVIGDGGGGGGGGKEGTPPLPLIL